MTSPKAVNSGQTEREADRDAVTREQIESWAKLAGIEHFTEKGLERLGDFAIFARQARAASTATATDGGQTESNTGVSADFKAWFEREWASYQDKAISDGKITSMTWALKGYRAAPTQARAAAPQGLTDEQRIAIEAAISISADIESECHDGSFLSSESVQALRALLAEQSAAPMAEPIYQTQMVGNAWIDASREEYERTAKCHPQWARVIYVGSPPRASERALDAARAKEPK